MLNLDPTEQKRREIEAAIAATCPAGTFVHPWPEFFLAGDDDGDGSTITAQYVAQAAITLPITVEGGIPLPDKHIPLPPARRMTVAFLNSDLKVHDMGTFWLN